MGQALQSIGTLEEILNEAAERGRALSASTPVMRRIAEIRDELYQGHVSAALEQEIVSLRESIGRMEAPPPPRSRQLSDSNSGGRVRP